MLHRIDSVINVPVCTQQLVRGDGWTRTGTVWGSFYLNKATIIPFQTIHYLLCQTNVISYSMNKPTINLQKWKRAKFKCCVWLKLYFWKIILFLLQLVFQVFVSENNSFADILFDTKFSENLSIFQNLCISSTL